MKKRLDALARIGKVQAHMHDLGRWRVSSLEREQAELSGALKAVFEMLERDELAYGAQAGLAARHVRAVQRKLDSIARESAVARDTALAHGRRAKLAEQAVEAAAVDHRRRSARKELAELIERAIVRR